MNATPESVPKAPVTAPDAVPAVAPENTLDAMMDQVLSQIELPKEVQDAITEIKRLKGDVEDVYSSDQKGVELDSLRETITEEGFFGKLCKHFLGKRITDEIARNASPEDLGDLAGLIPNIDEAANIVKAKKLALVDDKQNIVPNRAMVASFIPSLFMTAINNAMSSKTTDIAQEVTKEGEESNESLQTLFAMYPPGGTVVESPGKGIQSLLGGADSVKFKIFLAAQGIKMRRMTPKNSAFVGAVPENEIRIVQVPDDTLPKLETGWNLEIVDQFVSLAEKGKTVWQENQLHAMVLVRQGVSPEQALESSGVVPAEQEFYSKMLADLKTLPAKGEGQAPEVNP